MGTNGIRFSNIQPVSESEENFTFEDQSFPQFEHIHGLRIFGYFEVHKSESIGN